MPFLMLRSAALSALVLAVVTAPAARAEGARSGSPLNRVTSVAVSAKAGGATVVIHGSLKPTFTVFKLSEPTRVVVDLSGADVTLAGKPLEVHQGGVSGVTAAQFDEGQIKVGRIVVELESDARYQVEASGNDLLVTISAAAVSAAAPAVATPDAKLNDPNFLSSSEDESAVKNPAHQLTSVSLQGQGDTARVRITTDGEVAHFGLVELQNPGRLAIDLHGVAATGRHAAAGKGPLLGVRVAKHDDGLRVVLDGSAGRFPKYEVQRRVDGLEVRIGQPSIAQAKQPAKSPVAVEVANAAAVLTSIPNLPKVAPLVALSAESAHPAPESGRLTVAQKLVEVRAVDLRTDQGRTEVRVALDGAVRFEVTRPDATTAVLTLHGAALPDRLERNLDASSLGGPVSVLSCYRAPGAPGEVKVVATLAAGTHDDLEVLKSTLTWKFGGPKPVAQAAQPPARAAAMASEAKAATQQGNVYDANQFTGRRVDFNVKDIEIKNLLTAIAEISKKNIIVADDVKGTVTIKLRNVPWDQALAIILKSKGLAMEEIGNIIRVAPAQTLRDERKADAEAYKNQVAIQPLKVRLIPVNYAKAGDIASQLKDTLTDRGTVNVDVRTNTLVVKDVQEALLRAVGIVHNLDTQTPEVLIEARIVEAATSFSRSAGIQWGGNVSLTPATGNPTGLIFPNLIQAAGAADDPGAPITGLTGVTVPNFAVNMPAAIGLNNGAGVGFAFGSAGGAANLNLRLSAAENSGTIKTISSPRVVTVDNTQASIGQGVSIPYAQTSAAGVSTTFVEARLELSVTPHVTQEGSIQMKINASNNQPNPQLTGSNGQPSISRREAKTEVLVKDGDTTVIGGIYTRQNSEAWNEVPVLSKIPILGWLFKKKTVFDNRTELLIFITPRIVNRSQSAVAAGPVSDDAKQ